MKTEFIIKTAENRGYTLVRTMYSNIVLATKNNHTTSYNSFNEFYNKALKNKKA